MYLVFRFAELVVVSGALVSALQVAAARVQVMPERKCKASKGNFVRCIQVLFSSLRRCSGDKQVDVCSSAHIVCFAAHEKAKRRGRTQMLTW